MADIQINFDVKCVRCGKKGAVVNAGNVCMTCITKGIESGEFDHILCKPKEATNGHKS